MASFYDRLIEFLLIFLIVFTPLAYGSVEPGAIAIFEITAAIMALLWFFKMIANGKFEFVRSPFIGLIFLFLFYISLQLILPVISPNTVRSIYPWATKTELLKVISYALIFLVTLNTIKTKQQITRLLYVIILVGFFMGIFYLMRYFGVNAPRGLIQYNHYSAYLGMIIPVSLSFIFINPSAVAGMPVLPRAAESGEGKTRQSRPHILILFVTIIMSVAKFFTMSRGGMISFIASLLVMASLIFTRKSIQKKGWIMAVIIISIVVTIGWLGATPVIERILSIKAEVTSLYFTGRIYIWQGTLDIIKNNPFFGTGLGTFNYIYPKYQLVQNISSQFVYAHSDIFELISETGIPFFLLVAGYWILATLHILRRFYIRHNPWVIGISIGFFGSMAGIFLHSFTDFSLKIPANAILLVIILSLCLTTLHTSSSRGEKGIRHSSIKSTGMKLSGEGGSRLCINIPVRIKPVLYVCAIFLTGIFMIASARPAIANAIARSSLILSKVAGKNDEAISRAKYAIRLDPANANYHYRLGKLYAKKKTSSDVQRSIYELKKAVELNPTNSIYHQSLAWTYGQLSLFRGSPEDRRKDLRNKSREHFQKAITFEPNNAYRYRAYAIWLFNHPDKKNIEKGVMEYKKAAELKPVLAKEAIDQYYKVTKDHNLLDKIIPDTIEGHLVLNKYFVKHGLDENALKEEKIILDKLSYEISKNQDNQETYKNVGRIYLSLKKYDKAIETYHKAVELGPPDSMTYYQLAESYNRAKEPDQAIKYYKISSELDPDMCRPYVRLAGVYQRQGELMLARSMWQTIISLKSCDPDAARAAGIELMKY